jgi:hypothetical protein
MHVKVAWHLRIDAIEKPAELSRAVTAVHLPDDLPTGHVQGGKQRGTAVAFVVVGCAARLGKAAWARSAEYDPGPGAGSFHRRTAPVLVRAG